MEKRDLQRLKDVMCNKHEQLTEYIYINKNQFGYLICYQCLLEDELDLNKIIEIDQLIQENEETINQKLPIHIQFQLFSFIQNNSNSDDVSFKNMFNRINEQLDNFQINKINQNNMQNIISIEDQDNFDYMPEQEQEQEIQPVIKKHILIEYIQQLKKIPFLTSYEDITINLSNELIIDDEIQKLCDTLKQCQYLMKLELNLDNHNIGDNELIQLCKALEYCKNIKEFKLYLTNSCFGQQGIEQLNKTLYNYNNIQCLILCFAENMNIGDQNMIIIMDYIKEQKYLIKLQLDLASTGIGQNTVKSISDSIQSLDNLNILRLDLEKNGLINEDILYLCQKIIGLGNNLNYLCLHLSGNLISDDAVNQIIQNIQNCFNLTDLILDLSNNQFIGDKGKEQIQQFNDNIQFKFQKIKQYSIIF